MSSRVQVRSFLLGLLATFIGCQAVAPLSGPPSLEVSTLFVDRPSHDAHECLKGLAKSYLDYPDGVLFFDRTSKVKAVPPRRARSEPYHGHVLHRVAGGQVLDHVAVQDRSGLIEVDLSRFDAPESLIITSAPLHLKEQEYTAGAEAHAAPAEGVIPAYTMSLKLVPSDQWEILVKQNPARVELDTEWGTLHTFVQAFNRRDMFISFHDPEKRLRTLIDREPYVYLKPTDAYLPPRLTVEVATDGVTWQRAGTWPMPEWIDRLEGEDAKKPFVFRIPEGQLFSFGPPARVDLTMPKDPVATTARIDARFTGVRSKEALKFVLACAYPLRGKGDFEARVQTHDITAADRNGSYTAALDGLDQAAFPLTAAITHRFVNPWAMQGGMYRPVPPREKVILAALPKPGPRRLHSTVFMPRYASHYDFLAFFGDAGAKGRYRSLAEAYHGRPGDGPSPNVIPPPVFGPPPTPPPGTPPGGTPPGDDPAGNDPTNDPRRGGGLGAGMVGAGGGGNNDPDPPPGMPGITVTLQCPGKGGCGMNNCTCPSHMWTQSAVMNGIWSAFAPTGPADISFFGAHGASAPCHKVTPIAVVRVSYWGVGFQLIHVFYKVSVTFQPCVGFDQPPPKENPPPPLKEGGPVGGPGSGSGGSGSGGGALVVVTGSLQGPADVPLNVTIMGLTGGGPLTVSGGALTTTPGTTIPLPYSDPGFMAQGGYIRNVLGGGTLPTWVFALSDQRIEGIASGFGLSYYARPVGGEIVSSVGWNPNLSESWGIYQAVTSTGGSPGGSPPPPPPPTCDPNDYYCTGQTKPIR